MRFASLLLVAVGCSVFGCRTKSAPSEPTAAANAQPAEPERKHFGDPVSSRPRAELDKVLASPAAFKDGPVVVEGTVRRACSRKGCWMELAASKEASAPGCRVTFKDYGFFVPTDSAGSSARVEANVEVAKLEPSYVAHMEQEGATFRNKRPDGSADEVRLVATGVELWR